MRERLVMYTAALERAKAKEMVKYFSEVLNDQLLKLHNEDGDLNVNFDVRAKIREVLQKPLEKHLTEILEKCKYENYTGSRFDEELCDVVVNGSEKMSQGQLFFYALFRFRLCIFYLILPYFAPMRAFFI